MLDSLLLLQSLQDAQQIFANARIELAGKSSVIWTKVYNSQKYLDAQVAELLAPPDEEFTCRGCGREEGVCSSNPCEGVKADRGEEVEDTPQSLLDAAVAAQLAYWDALHNLEAELEIDLDNVGQLEGLTVKEVIDTYGT